MTAPDEFDCWHTDELVCPYCGEEQGDSWEVSPDDGDLECGSCGRTFMYSREVSVAYTTRPIIGPHRLSDYVQQQELEDSDG